MRIEVLIEKTNPLLWLNNQTMYPKIYWESPCDSLIVAGIGSALSFKSLPTCHDPRAPRFFGGEDFSLRKQTTWQGIPPAWYNLPLVEMTKENAHYKVCFNLTKDIDLKALVKKLVFNEAPLEDRVEKPKTRQDVPSCPLWQQNITHCLDLIEKKTLTKVVLARLTRFVFHRSLNPYQMLRKFQKASKEVSLFCFEFRRGLAFLGASPEILFKKTGLHITTAAVAGTRRRGRNPSEDKKLSQELLTSSKDIHEFLVVEDHITKALSALCKHVIKKDSQQIVKTPSVQHIISTFEGKLEESILDTDILKTLHPTPAVCGHLKKRALDIIKKKEPFDRGWYSAPVGWTQGDNAHFLVGIRSGLIRDSALHLFAATGIVKGSVPIEEWAELEQKISQFLMWQET